MRSWIVLLVAGCGRVGFDSAPSDAPLEIDAEEAVACPALPGLLFCESFEGDPMLPTIVGSVETSTVRAYRGTRSQHARTIGPSEASWQIGGVLPYVTSGDLYVRWYVYVPSSVALVHLASVHLVEQSLPYHGVIYGFRDASAEVTSSEAVVTASSAYAVPRDRWACAQMHVAISDTQGSIDGALDSQPFGPVPSLDTLPAGGFRNVHSGLFATSLSTGPSEIWTDELAVGTLPIPCD